MRIYAYQLNIGMKTANHGDSFLASPVISGASPVQRRVSDIRLTLF